MLRMPTLQVQCNISGSVFFLFSSTFAPYCVFSSSSSSRGGGVGLFIQMHTLVNSILGIYVRTQH